MLDIYTLLFLALALFIFFRLRSVLGQRTGREKPPFDVTSRDSAKPPANDGNVVPLPTRTTPPPLEDVTPSDEPPPNPWAGVAEPGTPLAEGLDAVARVDRNFDLAHFTIGARAAYEMIVGAFAAGDRRTLKSLLEKEVYDGFVAAIAEREARGETIESRFVSIDKATVTHADVKGTTANLTVCFVSQLITVTRDKDGTVVDGNPDQLTDVTDIWTFARNLASNDPNWKLIATEAA